MRRKTCFAVLGIFAALTLIASACGGDDSDGTAAPAAAPEPAPAPEPAAAPEPAPAAEQAAADVTAAGGGTVTVRHTAGVGYTGPADQLADAENILLRGPDAIILAPVDTAGSVAIVDAAGCGRRARRERLDGGSRRQGLHDHAGRLPVR